MKTKVKMLTSCLAFSVLSLAVVASLSTQQKSLSGQGCEHPKVNHYEAKDPTLTDEGLNHEYWVCCSCHKKWADSGYTEDISKDSIVLKKKTESTLLDNGDGSSYLIDKLNNSTLSNVSEHALYSNEGHASFFIKNSAALNGVTSFSFLDIPSATHTVTLSYKYYDLNHDTHANGFHSFATYGGKDYDLGFINDNAWHTLSLTTGGAASLSFNINDFQGELFIADIVYESDYSLDSVFSSKTNFDHYFQGTTYTLDSQGKKAVFSNLGTLNLSKDLFDQALSEGYTHMKFAVSDSTGNTNEMFLNAGAYQKLYKGSENTIRIDLTQVGSGDYSNTTLEFWDSSRASASGTITLSNLAFYKDNITTTWEKKAKTYACFEGGSLVIDTYYSGNDSYLNTTSDWYEQFVSGSVVNMYVTSEYLKQGDNTRGVVWGKNGVSINVIDLGDWSLTNYAYASGDSFRFCLDKEGVASLSIMNEATYNQAKARERLGKAFASGDSFASYFLTGAISSDTSFSSSNKSVTYNSKILGLRQALITDMSLAGYTNIAFDFQAVPSDGGTAFDHFVYTSDGLDASDAWKIIYDEYDSSLIGSSLPVDIDLSPAYSYDYSNDTVITIRPRRGGSENIDSTQTISNLRFYNANDVGKTCNLTFVSSDGTSTSLVNAAEAFTIPEAEDTANGVFKGWVCNGTTYEGGETICPSEDMNFLASYEEDLFSLKNDNYVIVYESNNSSASWAANDLKKYINSVLGATPSVVSDASYVFSKNAKLISIGNTTALKSVAKVVLDGSFQDVGVVKSTLLKKDDSFAIATRRNGLYLFGNNGNALRYASTKLIEEKLGVSFFSSEEESVKAKDDAIIQNGGKAYNPYFDSRTYLTKDAYGSDTEAKYSYNSHFYNDSDYASSNSIGDYDNAWITGTFADAEGKTTSLGTAHNTYDSNNTGLVKSSTYPFADYPNMWYSFDGSNITDIHYTDGVSEDGKIDRSTAEDSVPFL